MIIIAAAHAAPCFMRSHRLGALVAVTVTSSSSPPSYSMAVSLSAVVADAVCSTVRLVPFWSCRCFTRAFTGGNPVAGSLGCVVS